MDSGKIKKIGIVGVIIILIALFQIFDLSQYLSLEYLKSSRESLAQLYEQNTFGVIAAYFCIYVLVTSLSLPGAAQAHGQVDQEKRKGWNQSHGKEVKRSFFFQSLVYGSQFLPEAGLNPVLQQIPGNNAGQGGTDGAGKRHDNGAGHQPENSSPCQGHYRCTGQ